MPESVSSRVSENSKTAAEFIQEQLSLEAEAREALPYQFDTCTKPLGAIRQSLFSCLTCNPPPTDPSATYAPAGVCYSCSISCHTEHTLVELFGKRNFVCDCGTARIPETTPCTLRLNPATGQKGDVTGEEPAKSNRYNQNFRNNFCGCGEEYDPHQEKGTMFQCLGLGTAEEGGCGEDWWHPECIVGLDREEFRKRIEAMSAERKELKKLRVADKPQADQKATGNGAMDVDQPTNGGAENTDAPKPTVTAENGTDGNDIAADAEAEEEEDDDTPLPPGFPAEDDFENFICYKCVEAHPWIKRYAGTEGFLPPVFFGRSWDVMQAEAQASAAKPEVATIPEPKPTTNSKKRKTNDDTPETSTSLSIPPPVKRQKSEDPTSSTTLSSIPEDPTTTTLPITTKETDPPTNICKLALLPHLPSPTEPFSLFLHPHFRSQICHCPTHFPLLTPHPQLLEEEETYSPPVSESSSHNHAGSIGTGSIYDRGEAAFSTMDRVQAIQGAMAYANLKDGLKAFLQPFAESKQAVGAEDIKAYFEKLRGDEQGIRDAAGGAKRGGRGGGGGGGGGGKDDEGGRREQSGY